MNDVAYIFDVSDEAAEAALALVQNQTKATVTAFAAQLNGQVTACDLDIAVVGYRGAVLFDLSEAGGGFQVLTADEWKRELAWRSSNPYLSRSEARNEGDWKPYPSTNPGWAKDYVEHHQVKVGSRIHMAMWDYVTLQWRKEPDGSEGRGGGDCPPIRGVSAWRRVRRVFESADQRRYVQLYLGGYMAQHMIDGVWKGTPALSAVSHVLVFKKAHEEKMRSYYIADLFDHEHE